LVDAVKTGIDGVRIYPLRVISDERGAVLHMLRADQEHFQKFGEVYFSEVLPDVTKGWKRHRRQVQHLAVPVGDVRFTLQDTRRDSATNGEVATVDLGRSSTYGLLRIPPGIWYAFTSLSVRPCLVANCADLPHDPDEAETTELSDVNRPVIIPPGAD
jgi:dTDP-4-dehydrorhamnose 3,5-epimerase